MKHYIAADIGGTKTLLHLTRDNGGEPETLKKQRYDSGKYPSFEKMLAEFVDDSLTIHAASLAIAGPISTTPKNQTANVTNLPWEIDANALSQQFKISHCALINDFEAIGYALSALTEQDLITLQSGLPRPGGIQAVIGAGTGLGQAIVIPSSSNTKVISTEGGHTDFSPSTELEIALLRFLQQRWTHVSWERVLSGMGIKNLFDFLIAHHGLTASDYQEILDHSDPPARIAQLAQQQSLPLASEAMQLFCRLYGAQAGNLALNCLPFGGLYIAGGIAAKNQELIISSQFLDSFLAKGRMQFLINDIPIYLITNTDLGLIGATQHALQLGN